MFIARIVVSDESDRYSFNFILTSVGKLFIRDEGNPILKPADWSYRVNSVFNPGAVEFNGETLLLVRVEDMKAVPSFYKEETDRF